MSPNLSPSVAICAMARTGQPRLEGRAMGYETILSINNTHAIRGISPDLIIAMDDLQRDVKTEPKYVDAIVNQGCPVLSTGRRKKWPNVEAYPLKAVTKFLEQHLPFPAHKLLDNSINYAVALCLSQGVEKIGLFGVDLTAPYRDVDLECAMVQWKHKGYGHAPWWFCHYDRDVLAYRRPMECGWESLHFLIGWGMGRGVEFEFMSDSTILNADRPDFFYGYQSEPRL